MFSEFCRYTTHSRGFTFVCCIDGIQQFLTSGFSSRDAMFGLKAVVSKTAINLSSYVKQLLKVVCKSVENLSFLLYCCLTIKGSKLCCTPLLCPMYFCQIILKVLSYLFFLLPLPPIFETSFPWCTALDSVEYQSVLSCLIQCLLEAFSPLQYFFPLTASCQYH